MSQEQPNALAMPDLIMPDGQAGPPEELVAVPPDPGSTETSGSNDLRVANPVDVGSARFDALFLPPLGQALLIDLSEPADPVGLGAAPAAAALVFANDGVDASLVSEDVSLEHLAATTVVLPTAPTASLFPGPDTYQNEPGTYPNEADVGDASQLDGPPDPDLHVDQDIAADPYRDPDLVDPFQVPHELRCSTEIVPPPGLSNEPISEDEPLAIGTESPLGDLLAPELADRAVEVLEVPEMPEVPEEAPLPTAGLLLPELNGMVSPSKTDSAALVAPLPSGQPALSIANLGREAGQDRTAPPSGIGTLGSMRTDAQSVRLQPGPARRRSGSTASSPLRWALIILLPMLLVLLILAGYALGG